MLCETGNADIMYLARSFPKDGGCYVCGRRYEH